MIGFLKKEGVAKLQLELFRGKSFLSLRVYISLSRPIYVNTNPIGCVYSSAVVTFVFIGYHICLSFFGPPTLPQRTMRKKEEAQLIGGIGCNSDAHWLLGLPLVDCMF